MGKAKERKKAKEPKGVAKLKLKPKQRLKLKLGKAGYAALKKKCCDPKHPHCRSCPLVKALREDAA